MKLTLKHALSFVAAFGSTTAAFALDGTAVDVDMINKLGATVKTLLLDGNGALVIDGIILAGAAYGTAMTKSPAPIVGGIISCGVFHLATKLLMGD